MHQVHTIEELNSFIQKQGTETAVIMVSLCSAVLPEQLTPLLGDCKKQNIAVMALYDADIENDVLQIEFSDYITRPYSAVKLKARIRNAIADTKMEQYKQQKELNKALVEMRKRAERDVLTGLFNRAEFKVRIDNFFDHNDSPNGIFIILDIDNFKAVNDNFGHLVGDVVIHKVGNRLMQVFPETEIVGRIGGDEFAVFIPYMLSPERLEEKLHHLCIPMVLEAEGVTISCSAGVCFTPDFGITHKDLYKNADMALLSAKRHGKSKFEIFDEDTKGVLPYTMQDKTVSMLDHVSDAMFVSDAITSKIIYINQAACGIVNKDRQSCLNKRCYELFWDICQRCDRCVYIDSHSDDFYEETTYLKDNKTPIHLKARVEEWDGRNVKVHYLSLI